jgi:hypothetical protein
MKTLFTLLALVFITTAQAQYDLQPGSQQSTLSEINERQELLNNYFNTNKNASDTNVMQIGNYNSAYIDGNKIKLNQQGQDQSFYYYETSILPSDLNVNVEGINTSVEIFGNNQILNRATINIKGNDRSVIIRNYQ